MLKIANKNFKPALITVLNNIMENMLEMIEEIETLSRKIKKKKFYKEPNGNSKTEIYSI